MEKNGKLYNDFYTYENRLKWKCEKGKMNNKSDSEICLDTLELMCP